MASPGRKEAGHGESLGAHPMGSALLWEPGAIALDCKNELSPGSPACPGSGGQGKCRLTVTPQPHAAGEGREGSPPCCRLVQLQAHAGGSVAPAELRSDCSLFFVRFAMLGFLNSGKHGGVIKKTTLKMSHRVLHDALHEDESSWGPRRDTAPEQTQRPLSWPAWDVLLPLETSAPRHRSRG